MDKMLRVFAKNFPDDICNSEFLLEWSLTLFKLGKIEDTRQKVTDTYFCDTRVLNKFFGREVTMVDETINSYERDWSEFVKRIFGNSDATSNGIGSGKKE